jgi:hypothetical protein
MWKKVLVALVLLGFAWSVPSFRQRIASGVEPALARLGPVGEQIMRPAQRWRASSDVAFLVKQMEALKLEGRPIPTTQQAFEQFAAHRTGESNGLDPWGRPYWMRRTTGFLTVGSDGPDGERNTADDIRKTVPF